MILSSITAPIQQIFDDDELCELEVERFDIKDDITLRVTV